MSDVAELARLEERVAALTAAVNNLTSKVDGLTAQANRWKGAFWVILALGGAASWLAQFAAERVWR